MQEYSGYSPAVLPGSLGSEKIAKLIKSGRSFSAGKMGMVEAMAIYADSKGHLFDRLILSLLENNAGVFGKKHEIEIFVDEFIQAYLSLDVFGVWITGDEHRHLNERGLCNVSYQHNPDIILTEAGALECFYYDPPWISAASQKKLLVISPFASLIEKQYKNISNIWHGLVPNDMDLKTIECPFAYGISDKTKYPYNSWVDGFDDLKYMVSKQDFDLALIGAGAWSVPLASFIGKKLKKQAIHTGGPTQLFFGIMGERWVNSSFYSKKINEHWVRPSQNNIDIPPGYKTIEDGCYW